MSMISSQCDKLRELAKAFPETSPRSALLLDAADLILEMRDGLQRANEAVRDAEHDESMAWDRVRKAEAENAKLRTQLTDVTESMGRVEERCAKLRELCRDMFTTISWCSLDCYPSDNKKREYADRMRGLGADVDDSV